MCEKEEEREREREEEDDDDEKEEEERDWISWEVSDHLGASLPLLHQSRALLQLRRQVKGLGPLGRLWTNDCFPPNSYVEALTPNVMLLEARSLVVIRVR